MINQKEESIINQEFLEKLTLITDFSVLEEGHQIFNKESINTTYVDTFISYTADRDMVEYKNCFGEVWCGSGKGYWYDFH